MKLEDIELSLRKLSYVELFFKKRYTENQPAVVHWTIWDDELWQAQIEFTQQMVDAYGPEQFSFLGTGHADKHSKMKIHYFDDEKPTESENLISDSTDIALVKLPRYVDTTLMLETVNVYFVLNGVFNTEIDEKTHSLSGGNLLLLPPCVPHRYFIDNDDTIVLSVMIKEASLIKCFPHLVNSDNSNLSGFLFSKMLSDEEKVPFCLVNSPIDENLKNAMLNIAALQYQEKVFYSKLMMRNIVEYIFYYIFSYYVDNTDYYYYGNKINKLASNILNYLHQNLSNATLDNLAESFSYSSAHMGRILFQLFGKRYKELISEIRLEKACDLLIYTGLSIEEICCIIGYKYARHLRYLFKDRFGISPSQYRKTKVGRAHNPRCITAANKT